MFLFRRVQLRRPFTRPLQQDESEETNTVLQNNAIGEEGSNMTISTGRNVDISDDRDTDTVSGLGLRESQPSSTMFWGDNYAGALRNAFRWISDLNSTSNTETFPQVNEREDWERIADALRDDDQPTGHIGIQEEPSVERTRVGDNNSEAILESARADQLTHEPMAIDQEASLESTAVIHFV